MKIYQPQKRNPYILPHNLYMQTLYLIRDYDRLKREHEDIINETPQPADGQPKGNGVSDTVAKKVQRAEPVYDKIRAIDNAQAQIPEEYRIHIIRNVMDGTRYPITAGIATWSRQRCRFIYYVAKNMDWI